VEPCIACYILGIDQLLPRIPSQLEMEVTMEAMAMMMEMITMVEVDAEEVKGIILLFPAVPVTHLMIQWIQETKARKMYSDIRW
jgi:hypothetical protein